MRASVLSVLLTLVWGCVPPVSTMDGGDSDAGLDAGVDAGPRDLDVAVVRLNSDGTLDTSFGAGGVARLDLGAATGSARDAVYGFDFDAMGRVVLFGSTKATGRSDVDRFVARLTMTGQLDTSFGVDGLHRLDLGNTSESARHGFVQSDGKIVTSGYSAIPTGVTLEDGGVQTANHIVLLRLEATGVPDVTFGVNGVVKENPFIPSPVTVPWGMAEAYGVVPQSGGRLVTTGYGRVAASGQVDLVSLRFDSAGKTDSTWASNGVLKLDLVGADERGRHAVVLPDERVVMVGSGTPLTGNVDAMVTVTKTDGSLDTSFGGGFRTFSFGRNDEAFLAGAIAPGAMTLAVAGYRTGPANSASENDDAVLALIPLSAGAPAEFAQAVPLSAEAHDRFVSVAWAGNSIVAAGFMREGGNTKMAIARFLSDGTRDSTFGTGGLVTLDLSDSGVEETARWVKVTADGKLLVAGVHEH